MTVASVADVEEPVPKAGLDPASCLRSPPPDERCLLELELRWPGLTGAEARVAARLRLFVLTWDPLEWLPERGEAWATINGDGDTYELVVYVLRDALAGTTGLDVARTVGPFGESAVLAGTACEELLAAGAHAQLVAAGRAAPLLDGPADDRGLGGPSVTVRSAGWEPIGLGAIQDLVQDAFGPVDLDRSTVALSARLDAETDCPACAGGRFGFPGDLADATRAMCRPHREEASAVTATRIARARRSNPAGWRALGKASARLNDLPEPAAIPPPARRAPAAGRNDPCPCGSGRKYKRCCGQRF